MTRVATAVVALLIANGLAAQSREIEESLAVAPGQALVIDFHVGELEVEARDIDRVEGDFTVRCTKKPKKCEKKLAQIAFLSEVRGGVRHLELAGPDRWSGLETEGTLLVPRSSPLTVDMGIGDLEISGVRKDLAIDLGIGNLDLVLFSEHYRRVSVDVGLGDAEIRGEGAEERRPLVVGSEILWSLGRGEAEARVDVGIGDATVRLE